MFVFDFCIGFRYSLVGVFCYKVFCKKFKGKVVTLFIGKLLLGREKWFIF